MPLSHCYAGACPGYYGSDTKRSWELDMYVQLKASYTVILN